MSSKIPVERLCEEPYRMVICYPRPSIDELEKRLKELRRLGVTAIEFIGGKKVADVSVLGKGCVGIVVKAYRIHEEVALKIRRVDADRAGMRHEAEMLTAANKVDVGPKLLGVSDNFLLMEFIEGKLFPEWLDSCYDKVRIRRVLRNLLEQCWRLDTAGIDHGELSHAPKHILVNAFDVPFIVDFETASLNRKPSNVTSLAQFLFINGVIADKIANILGWADRKTIICVLRHYKLNRNRENFDMILKACGI